MALLPSIITLGNGVCGVLAIFNVGLALDLDKVRYFQTAAWLILAGMIFDALDGFVARMTKTASSFGAQLDSLCDLVTFGVAPSYLVFALSRSERGAAEWWDRVVLAVCVLYAMCALIRLARFTVETTPDESSHREFAGLPSPAAAGVVAAAVLPSQFIQAKVPDLAPAITAALPGLAFAAGVLMVSRVRYAHVINRVLKGNRPFVTLLELVLVGSLVVIFKEFSFFLAFFGYAVMGPVFWLKRRFLPRRAPAAGAVPVPDRSEDLF